MDVVTVELLSLIDKFVNTLLYGQKELGIGQGKVWGYRYISQL